MPEEYVPVVGERRARRTRPRRAPARPHRSKCRAELPTGWTDLVVDGERYRANFVKIALNVVRRQGSDENDLPRLLRGFFGPTAGFTGTRHRGGRAGASLAFKRLGETMGFGSYHFSRETVEAINDILAQSREGRRVNSIFGEGVNPRMRKIREGLEAVGFASESLLNHGSPRIVYGVALASNFREVLMGKSKKPQFLLPHRDAEAVTGQLADYWRRRWLLGRMRQPQVISAVARHTLVYPIRHGARVLSEDGEEQMSLFGTEDGMR